MSEPQDRHDHEPRQADSGHDHGERPERPLLPRVRRRRWIALCALATFLAGCAGPEVRIRSAWSPEAPQPRRIGVLPLSAPDAASSTLLSDALGDALTERTGAATVALPAEGERADQLRRGLERGQLPTTAILRASRASGVDAVLVGRVTRYRAFPPQAIGLEVALVSAVNGQVLWNALGVVDASDPETLNAIRGGFLGAMARADPVGALDSFDDPEETFLTLSSPEAFARFVAQAFVRR